VIRHIFDYSGTLPSIFFALNCTDIIVFISWTHSGYELDVIYNATTLPTSIYYTGENQEWLVDNITADRPQELRSQGPDQGQEMKKRHRTGNCQGLYLKG